MKILYFHQHFSTPKGSVGSRSFEMALALTLAGHEVTMVCGRFKGGQTGLSGPFKRGKRSGIVDGVKGLSVIEIDLPYSNEQSFLKRTSVFLKFAMRSIGVGMTHKYDVVFATTTPLTAGIPGIFARWLRGKPFVFEVRDLWPELPKAMGVITNPIILKMMSALEFMSYRSAHRCIGLAPGIVEGIAARGVAKDKITLVPNGCDIDLFQAADAARPEGVKDTDLVAIYGGTHGIANGLHNALNAAEVLKSRGREDIKIVLIGSGIKKKGLVADAKARNLTNVIFMDPMPKTVLAGYFKGADIGLQLLDNIPAFYYGTSPNKFFDYIATGKPVVNNYPGWVADLVTEHQCGWTVAPDAPDAFADALEDAHARKADLADMGGRSLSLAKAKFNRETLAQSFIDVLEQTANDRQKNN